MRRSFSFPRLVWLAAAVLLLSGFVPTPAECEGTDRASESAAPALIAASSALLPLYTRTDRDTQTAAGCALPGLMLLAIAAPVSPGSSRPDVQSEPLLSAQAAQPVLPHLRI